MRKDIGVDQLAHRAGTALHELELLGLAEIHAGLRNTLDPLAVFGAQVGARRGSAGRDSQRDRQNKSRSEEHTSELQSLMRISYAVFCLKKKKQKLQTKHEEKNHYKK